MTLKGSVQRIVVPQLNEIGFILTYSSPRNYDLKNSQTGIGISITVPPRCPSEFICEYLSNAEKKKQGDPEVKYNSYVTFSYTVQLPGGYVNLSPYMFESSMGVEGGFVYCNSDTLEKKMTEIINETKTVVIPYLEKMSRYYIGPSYPDELTELLITQKAKLIQKVMKKFDLPTDYSCGYKMIEPALFQLRGDAEKEWKNNFYQNLEDIAGLIAYLAECISVYSHSTEWFWNVIPAIQTSDGVFPSTKMLYFSAKYGNDREKDFNFFQIICNLWNFYPCVKCIHIESLIDNMIIT